MKKIVTSLAAFALVSSSIVSPAQASIGPTTSLHYVPNGEQFNNSHVFIPGKYGFNVADIGVDNTSKLGWLKGNTKALLWVGTCGGATTSFKNRVNKAIKTPGHTRILAFFLIDEPDPTGIWHTPKCTAAKLKAQSDYVHSKGYKTFITLMLMSSANDKVLSFSPGYNYGNSRVDYFGVSAYPCRTNNGTANQCDMNEIKLTVSAANKQLVGKKRIIPIYQAFGGGSWEPEGDGKFTVPTANEVRQQLVAWKNALGTTRPVFDMAYSWGEQEGDTALESPNGANMLNAFKESH